MGMVKVRIEMTVEVDAESWTMNYGVEGTAAIREDVKEYCRHTILNQLSEVGVLTPVDGGSR